MSVNNPVEIHDFNLTPRAKKALQTASDVAADSNHNTINNSHVLYGCLMNASERFWKYLAEQDVQIDLEIAKVIIHARAKERPELFCGPDKASTEVGFTLETAEALSDQKEQHYIGIEHVLWAILETDDDMCEYLVGAGIDALFLGDIIYAAMEDGYDHIAPKDPFDSEEDTGFHEDYDTSKSQAILQKYGTSLNFLHYSGKLPDVYGREDEINEMVEVLCKKNKSNVLLLGEAGVGKTAVVEALAKNIVEAKVPCSLIGYDIYLIDLGSMVAGTRYRGEFEEKFTNLIKAAEDIPNCILFFDEIHNLFGAGNADGALDASNMLKPALARGSIKCIGATTNSEYKKIFEKDSAMKRRFEPIVVAEPSVDEMKVILERCSSKYSTFHNVSYSKGVLELIVDLSERYLPHRQFPDKAFDILDQVGSKVKVLAGSLDDDIVQKHKRLSSFLNGDKPEQNPKKGQKLLSDYMESIREFYAELESSKPRICKQDVIEIVAAKSGVSVRSITNKKQEFSYFLDNLKKDVFGQNKNLEIVNDVLSCSKAGLNDESRPLGSFLFVGQTSVGKTYTAKKIAEYFFGNKQAFLQVNMSEYQDKGSINKLVGTSAGFVGYEEGGLLTDFVSKNPNAVVLFDEVEKANPKVLDLLLHLLDEGYINDNLNRKVDFTKSIVILTSNVGHGEVTKKTVGFVESTEKESDSYRSSVKKHFRPELVARLNEIIVFNGLGDEELKQIIETELSKIREKLKRKNISLSCPASISSFILNKVKNDKLHARNIKDLVKQFVQVPLAKKLMTNQKIEKISLKEIDNAIKIQ
mgnify:CR=1 FL=1|jgi:ATP-dependent Clp protease ATP-binding subunit ClpC|tara:strand:+ start:6236 stop:8662 length:2427 start_codon:yes stop_codon:yes gene_type:complete